MIATDTVRPALANNLRTRALAANMLRPATRRPAIKATTSVLVWVRISMVPITATAARVRHPGNLPQNQSTTTSPSATAEKSATCTGVIGQNSPESRPPARARWGDTMRPRSTEQSTTPSAL